MNLRDRDNAGDSVLEERRVYVQNWRADVVAVVRDDGLPLEYVRYSSYGEATVYPVADVNRDGVVNATDAAEWDKLMAGTSNTCAVDADLDRNGDAGTPDDQELFDDSYAQHSGLSGVGRVSSASVGNRKGYAGYEWDETIAVYHVRHRVYLPEIGRWSRRDPLGYVDGMSLYEYCKSGSLRYVDPYGLQAEDIVQPPRASHLRTLRTDRNSTRMGPYARVVVRPINNPILWGAADPMYSVGKLWGTTLVASAVHPINMINPIHVGIMLSNGDIWSYNPDQPIGIERSISQSGWGEYEFATAPNPWVRAIMHPIREPFLKVPNRFRNDTMADAIADVATSGEFTSCNYSMIDNNCQNWLFRVLENYKFREKQRIGNRIHWHQNVQELFGDPVSGCPCYDILCNCRDGYGRCCYT